MRKLHRNIGFLVIGFTLMYCISGIVLTLRKTSFLKHTEVVEKHLSADLNSQDLKQSLHLRSMRVINEDNNVIVFEEGGYDKHTGLVNYKTTEYPEIISKLNSLHASSTDSPKHWLNIIYGVLLGFLALSSLWMYKPSKWMFKRGILLSVAGLVLTAIIVVL